MQHAANGSAQAGRQALWPAACDGAGHDVGEQPRPYIYRYYPQTRNYLGVDGDVVLDGRASSIAVGVVLAYQWAWLSRPFGSTVSLADAISTRPSFRPDLAGSYATVSVISIATTPVTAAGSGCCRTCLAGKPCGDSCISRTLSCTRSGGCAC